MVRMLQPVYSGKVLITNPERFFGELSEKEPNMLAPFIIVLIGAVISAVSAAMEFYCYSAASSEDSLHRSSGGSCLLVHSM